MPIRTSLGARRWSDESSAKKMSKNSLTKADLHPLCLSKRPVTAVCYCQRAGVLTKLTCLVRIHQWHTAEKRPQCPVPSLGAHLLQIKRYVQRKRTPCVFIRLRLLQTELLLQKWLNLQRHPLPLAAIRSPSEGIRHLRIWSAPAHSLQKDVYSATCIRFSISKLGDDHRGWSLMVLSSLCSLCRVNAIDWFSYDSLVWI